nr:MAG TPA: Large polyvalent protein associated domain 25 [Caudoviricetes sp.]
MGRAIESVRLFWSESALVEQGEFSKLRKVNALTVDD